MEPRDAARPVPTKNDLARRPPGLDSHAAEPIDVVIDALDADGNGIGRSRGRDVIVPFTLPGERVRVRLMPARPGRATRGVLDAVLVPSPHRVEPRCAHFGRADLAAERTCGGCSWQHVAYEEQLRLKTARVDRLVRDALPDAPAARRIVAGAETGTPWGFRHKVHFVFGSDAADPAAGPVMGHYARASRRVVPVRECPAHAERGNRVAFALRDACVRAGIALSGARPARDPRRHRARGGAALQSIALRVSGATTDVIATLVTTGPPDRALTDAAARVRGEDAPAALHVNVHADRDALIFGRDTRRIHGPARLREHVGGVRFLLSPTAFFQTNLYGAGALVALVRDALGGHGRLRVLDLFAGAGLFALALAVDGHTIVAVEESRDAVADGEASRRANDIPAARCRFLAQRVTPAVAGLGRFDAVVLDPPRQGCERRVLDAVFGALRPAIAVYVSCDPEALGRDLRLIGRHGYGAAQVQPVDMFPHTAHIETVVVLTRLAGRGRP